MKTSDLLSAIFIIVVFIGLYVLSFLVIGTKYIQDNWPLYRCNPSVMPFSSMFGHDTSENFTYCIQNMQTDYMGYLLEPINYMTSVAAGSLGDIGGSLNNFRNMFSHIRDSITGIVTGIFGVFLNMLIEFQKITMGIKDLMGKTIGILTTLLYVVDGTVMTMDGMDLLDNLFVQSVTFEFELPSLLLLSLFSVYCTLYTTLYVDLSYFICLENATLLHLHNCLIMVLNLL